MPGSEIHLRTEELARRHGQSTNQKSNFKYLMSTKTNRSTRNNQSHKENEIQSLLMRQTHKFAVKTTTPVNKLQGSQPLLPSACESSYSAEQHLGCSEKNFALKLKSHDEIQTNLGFANEEDAYVLRLESKLNEEQEHYSARSKGNEIGCMTEGCYYEKELEIKIQLLQKERDDIWNRIASTLQENLMLREQVEKLTLEKASKVSLGTQTDAMATLENDIQTEVNLQSMEDFDEKIALLGTAYQEIQAIKQEIEEAKLFCFKIINSSDEDSPTSDWGLKTCVSQALGMQLLKAQQQAQFATQIKNQIHQEQIANLRESLDRCSEKLSKAEAQAKNNCKARQNIEKLYKKEMEELKDLLQEKEEYWANQISCLADSFKEMIDGQVKQNRRYVQYVQSINSGWKQKQKLCSTLLSQAHKTIRSLMAQMREFEGLANTNYSKYLRSEKQALHLLPSLAEPRD